MLAELLVSIVYNSELENNKSTNTTKTCPHCSRVLMSTIIPRCSWCGEDLKQEEMYVHSEDWLNSKKIEDAWDDVLSEKQMSCFEDPSIGVVYRNYWITKKDLKKKKSL